MLRIIIFLGIAFLIFVPLNWVTIRQLLRIHPRRRRWILGAAIAGNVLWPVLPTLQAMTPLSRFARSVLGPVWFGWLSFAFLYAGFLLLLLIAWSLFARSKPFAQFARVPSRLFVLTLIAGFVAGCYQALVPLRVEHVPVRIAGLPASAEGMRLALITDLHVGMFTRPSRLQTIFAKTLSLRPDAVLLAGDLIDDDPHFTPRLLAGAATLPAEVPLLAVLGNHEMYGDPAAVVQQLEGSRIRLLVNQGMALGDVWIAGVSDRAAEDVGRPLLAPDLPKALAGKPASSVPIVLAHQPANFEQARRLRVPLVLTGHSHGGQLGFRPLGWSLAGIFLPYHMGLYNVPPTQLYVSTGTGYWLLPFRLGMTPEITLIELRRATP